MTPQLNIMGYLNRSEVNGPGCRAVVWVQGCWRECPDCFNPASWSLAVNQLVSVESFDQVERLWHCLQERFTFAADAEISIEVNPPTGYFDRWTLCFCSCHS